MRTGEGSQKKRYLDDNFFKDTLNSIKTGVSKIVSKSLGQLRACFFSSPERNSQTQYNFSESDRKTFREMRTAATLGKLRYWMAELNKTEKHDVFCEEDASAQARDGILYSLSELSKHCKY